MVDCHKSACTIWQLENLQDGIWIGGMKGHRLFHIQMNWLLQYWMRYRISINCTQCLVNLLSKNIWGVKEENKSPCALDMQARKNCYVWLNCHFPSIPIKHLYVHHRKTSSCPLLSCYYEFTASVCWAGVMIMHGTTRWYTKLVLTTGSLVDSLPPDHHIYHTTHITQKSSPPR